jgi:hypothetical protein
MKVDIKPVHLVTLKGGGKKVAPGSRPCLSSRNRPSNGGDRSIFNEMPLVFRSRSLLQRPFAGRLWTYDLRLMNSCEHLEMVGMADIVVGSTYIQTIFSICHHKSSRMPLKNG